MIVVLVLPLLLAGMVWLVLPAGSKGQPVLYNLPPELLCDSGGPPDPMPVSQTLAPIRLKK